MRVHRTATKAAATAATALLLFTGPMALAPAVAVAQPTPARPNSEPPPVDKSMRPAIEPPKADVQYTKNSTACIASATGNQPLVQRPEAQMLLRLDDAHRFATGKGVKIAIIDTGVEKHQLIADRVEAGGDYVVTAENGVVDCDGHGTEVAGVAASKKDPASGFVGAAPDATILAIRQTSDRYEFKPQGGGTDQRSTAGKVKTLAQAIVNAVDKGANVINISLTSCGAPTAPSEGERQLQAAIDWAVNTMNVVIVTAAGNIGSDGTGCSDQNDNQNVDNVKVVASPPWYKKDVLSVASIGSQGEPSAFSVWGPWVSIAAPGENIVSLDPKGTGLTNAKATGTNGALTTIQGTSFASPYVAGVAALVRERFPNLTARQVMDRLTMTAQHPGNRDGRDHKVGAGMINPVAALTAELPSEQPGALRPEAVPLMTSLGPPVHKDLTPLIVALSGTVIGVGLLLLTLFIVHTMNRNRDRTTTIRRV